MWRRLHVLSPVQVLIVASLSAASIAFPLTVQLASRHEGALIGSLFWPDTLNTYITFSLIFIGVLPALLGYYHLGRLGLVVNAVAGFALSWIMAVCGMLCFVVVGHYFGSVWLSSAVYCVCLVTVYLLLTRIHIKAATSPSVRDAQRKLRLPATGTL